MIPRTLSIILAAQFLVISCHSSDPEKYIPRSSRKREKYATPEPGTYLKPAAFALIKKFNEIIEEPDSFREPADWMMELVSPHQKAVLDTLLQFGELEVPVRIYYPTRESLQGNHPVTLFFHGGGFMMGSVEEYHPMVSKLARVTGNIFISVEYRLAPVHPFPAGVNDGYTCLRWLQQHGASIGADTTRITVMGDSAGGNIATVLTLMCRDNRVSQPVNQVLLYPGVTFSDTLFQSRKYFIRDAQMQYILTESFLKEVKASYLGHETSDRDPYVSPLEARLTGDLAPALIITAEVDPIRDGARCYAEKLRAAGIDVDLVEYSGMFHGFMSFHMILGDAVDAMKAIKAYLETR